VNRRGVIDSGSPNGARPSKMRRLRPKRHPAWAISKLLLLKKTLAARVHGRVVTNVSRRRLALPHASSVVPFVATRYDACCVASGSGESSCLGFSRLLRALSTAVEAARLCVDLASPY
jgi:hypothetical protein